MIVDRTNLQSKYLFRNNSKKKSLVLRNLSKGKKLYNIRENKERKSKKIKDEMRTVNNKRSNGGARAAGLGSASHASNTQEFIPQTPDNSRNVTEPSEDTLRLSEEQDVEHLVNSSNVAIMSQEDVDKSLYEALQGTKFWKKISKDCERWENSTTNDIKEQIKKTISINNQLREIIANHKTKDISEEDLIEKTVEIILKHLRASLEMKVAQRERVLLIDDQAFEVYNNIPMTRRTTQDDIETRVKEGLLKLEFSKEEIEDCIARNFRATTDEEVVSEHEDEEQIHIDEFMRLVNESGKRALGREWNSVYNSGNTIDCMYGTGSTNHIHWRELNSTTLSLRIKNVMGAGVFDWGGHVNTTATALLDELFPQLEVWWNAINERHWVMSKQLIDFFYYIITELIKKMPSEKSKSSYRQRYNDLTQIRMKSTKKRKKPTLYEECEVKGLEKRMKQGECNKIQCAKINDTFWKWLDNPKKNHVKTETQKEFIKLVKQKQSSSNKTGTLLDAYCKLHGCDACSQTYTDSKNKPFGYCYKH